MGFGLINRESSFFEVKAPSLEQKFSVLTDDIISFQVTEEIGNMLNGSISINDPDHIYSRIFRQGCKLECTWGYKSPEVAGSYLLDSKAQVFGAGYRQKVTGWVQSPSGSASSSGAITYNVNFFGNGILGSGKEIIHSEPTKADVVAAVFEKMGINSIYQYVNFTRGRERCTPTTYPVQTTNDFNFLLRCSKEWGAVFAIGQDAQGNLLGLFAEFDTMEHHKYVESCANASLAGAIILNYKGNPCNVKEYSWKNNMGLDGTGDNVQISMVNGQAVYHRYIAETQSIQTYTLAPEKIKKALGEKKGIAEQTALMKDWMNSKTFEEVKDYFILSKETTAPQGAGYSISVKMLGCAHVTAGIQAMFGKYVEGVGGGFPDFFQVHDEKNDKKVKSKWWVTKVTHIVDRQGYNMDLEIVDAFTLSGGLGVA